MRRILFLFFTIIVFSVFGYAYKYAPFFVGNINSTLAALGAPYTENPLTLADVYSDYHTSSSSEKVHILIVPGHEPTYGGAEIYSLYERNLVVEIAQDLEQYLKADGNYQPFTTRDTQSWNPLFADYFKNNWDAIIAWEQASRQSASGLTPLGVSMAPRVDHIDIPADVAVRLYGLTKWANENDIDIILHLHLNDYPGHSSRVPGKYSGLVIYTPAEQYGNNATTKAIANAIFKRLALYNPVNDLPVESYGIIDDQKLIAVGAHNTAHAASMLIEYDYIYEPQFLNPKVRSLALKDLAYQTYLGLQDFFTKNDAVTARVSYHPATLYPWTTPVTGKHSTPKDIYALQTALLMDDDFPPPGKNKNNCPHSGIFGTCTAAALAMFQKKNGISGENAGGSETFRLLNKIYSVE